LALEQERSVELLDVDPAILDWLERVGIFEQLLHCGFRIGVGAVKFHLISMWAALICSLTLFVVISAPQKHLERSSRVWVGILQPASHIAYFQAVEAL
jgi:hypothetical protein